jgi:hypothetical protein
MVEILSQFYTAVQRTGFLGILGLLEYWGSSTICALSLNKKKQKDIFSHSLLEVPS